MQSTSRIFTYINLGIAFILADLAIIFMVFQFSDAGIAELLITLTLIFYVVSTWKFLRASKADAQQKLTVPRPLTKKLSTLSIILGLSMVLTGAVLLLQMVLNGLITPTRTIASIYLITGGVMQASDALRFINSYKTSTRQA